MKCYKNLEAFEKRVRITTDWDDYFRLNDMMFYIYEYGGMADNSYVCFLNKRTHDMITVRYRLPSVQYVEGVKVEKGAYEFISLDYEPNAFLWRPI